VNITAQFADMIPYLATIMQFTDVSFALLQILPDGKAPCNELQNAAKTDQFCGKYYVA